MDKKKLLQDGLKKKQAYLIITKDMNLKKHFQVVESLEIAKKYKSIDDEIIPVTMYVE